MPAEIPVFVNTRTIMVPAGALVREAIRLAEPALLPACEAGEALLSDGRGLPIALDDRLAAGAILRVARTSRRGPTVTADDGS